MKHIPVLLHEVIEGLSLQKGMRVIDGTINGGGHSREILKHIMPGGSLIGIDLDPVLAEKTGDELKTLYPNEDIKVMQGSYDQVGEFLKGEKCDAIVLDLGFSSIQMEGERGFSFEDDSLDMRYNPNEGEPAYQIVNTYTEKELTEIFFTYGEEPQSRHIAKAVCEARKESPITKAQELSEIIERVYKRRFKTRSKKHPATRVFQALRIVTNHELDHVKRFLSVMPDILNAKGRCAVISFHSLEDRIVKHTFRMYEKEGKGKRITKKPIVAMREEVIQNPRSRSAKLRIFETI